MAGIAGILGSKAENERVERMLDTIRHRGEDEKSVHAAGSLVAGVCAPKLSAARGQGLAEADGIVVLFDGEIYNQRSAGLSDAEVALQLYKKHGRTFAAYLEGVFACAVFDHDELLLTRDAVGVRPIYWGRTADGDLCFASEIKALVDLAAGAVDLPPATIFSSKSGLAGYLARYPETKVPSQFEEAVRAVRETMTRAVQRRLEDGAVGACLLSGGLDSSIIACVAHELKADIPLVTVGMEGASDVENAKIVAQHLGMEHHIRLYDTSEIAESVERAVWTLESFDEDCVSGTISNLFASGKAREFTNCILSGEGGDELFGGYHLLKDVATEAGKLDMMHRLIDVAFNTALQRLDRAMMGNGITYRTPFIDSELVSLALQIPVQWKIREADNEPAIEKYILREAFRDLLPEPIYKRSKLRFAAGTGTDDCMDDIAREKFSDVELTDDNRKTPAGYQINTPRELWYYQLFKQKFPGLQFEKLVGRWDPGK
jgi:asparagine synthase (glutamine-hydrolysing)